MTGSFILTSIERLVPCFLTSKKHLTLFLTSLCYINSYDLTQIQVSALIECTHDWFLHPDKHREIDAVFFDLKKAFDTVPHQPLVHKLLQLNLDPRITTWIHNYLADRYQRVVINGECSSASQVFLGSLKVPFWDRYYFKYILMT